jgi:hypothetical protein
MLSLSPLGQIENDTLRCQCLSAFVNGGYIMNFAVTLDVSCAPC